MFDLENYVLDIGQAEIFWENLRIQLEEMLDDSDAFTAELLPFDNFIFEEALQSMLCNIEIIEYMIRLYRRKK